MLRNLMLGATASVAIALAGGALAQSQFGTAAEAKAMLEKAVAAVKADKAKALASFNAGTDGFKDRDLYPFCFNSSDGMINAAPPAVLGKGCATLVDKAGDKFCQRIWDAGKEGTFSEVTYIFPKPGSDTPVKKISFVTKVADQTCGVGYYP